MKSVRDIPVLENIPVLVRAALNVPVTPDGTVLTPFRLKRAVATIEYLQKKHARVVLISHIDPPAGQKPQGTETLKPVYEVMKNLVRNLSFCPAVTGRDARDAMRNLSPGHVVMLENLRRYPGETANSPEFAAKLAELGDVFVEDSFDVCHREHASVIGVPRLLPSYAGFIVEEEVRELTKALAPAHPALAVVGGAKFSTKEPVLTRLMEIYDAVFVTGALANDFMKAAGHPVGASLTSDADVSHIRALMSNKRLLLPKDYVVAPKGKTRVDGRLADIDDVKDDEAILDNGPKTIEMLAELLKNAKSFLWNGPLGNYENGFVEGTEALAKVVAASHAHSVVGGGDTIAAIEKLNLNNEFSFLSTGGGAMLGFLEKGTLPGIAALDL
jgi:3-phosphoglycerate kinase